ncbi:MAG: hypothetical protein RR303_07700 [Bacteroidales bacterium]
MITGPFKVSRAFSEGWKLTKQHWLVMIGLLLGFAILSLLLSLFQGSTPDTARFWIFQIVILAVSIIFQAGYYKMYLVASDGEEPEFNLFGKCIKKAFPFFIVSLLFGLGVVIGLGLLIVPGIWFMVRFAFAPIIFIDKEECGIMEAFKRSYALTEGHFWPLFGMGILACLIYVAGLIVLIVGVFLAVVWIYFAFTVTYRMLENPSENETVVIESETTV